MITACRTLLLASAATLLIFFFDRPRANANPGTTKQQSLDEWRRLTAPTAPAPRVFVKGDHVRFYFSDESGVEVFNSHWTRFRVPTGKYKVSSALLRWDQRLSRVPEHERGWREATVIAGAEWRQLATNLIGALTPAKPAHGVFYQAFLSDRLLYRDTQGVARVVLASEHPPGIYIEHRFSMSETLELMAHQIEGQLAKTYPADSLFLMMAPNARRFTQPLLLDRQQLQCVFLAPAALYDLTEKGVALAGTAQGVSALLPESHGIALLKCPVSSAARLVDVAVATLIKFIRLPLPKPRAPAPPVNLTGKGMNLEGWESWLDRYTGTRREDGALQLLIDGDQFFPRFREAIAQATNSIHVNVYIFDRDDVAVDFADLLKGRSRQVDVKVILDRMGSIGGGAAPPTSPLPEDFVMPSSIGSYLRNDSNVKVRTFLNPWFSSDHAKIIIADDHAWIGGMNIGREYRYEWHDLMVEVAGPVVNSLETEFRREWAHAGPLGDLSYVAAVLSGSKKTVKGPGPWIKVRLLPTKTGWKPFASAVLGSIEQAQSYVYVENPYLFDKRVILALVKARNRGVDVRVVLPCFNDFKAGGRGNIVIANYLIEHGVRVYFYPSMTHVKALLVDGWVCLGSGNLNHLSLRVNHEQNIATTDPAFVSTVEQQLFEQDFARSYELKEAVSVDWVDFLADLVLEGF
jgi:phosphatidylserine/phosphatidylglycerophosphate/cardiolipin synthase-like enzyme